MGLGERPELLTEMLTEHILAYRYNNPSHSSIIILTKEMLAMVPVLGVVA